MIMNMMKEAIITAGDGVGVGKVFHYVNGKYALHQRATYRIHPVSTKLSGRYLYHYFITKFPELYREANVSRLSTINS
ncbi:MAG: hypothetical protein ACLTRS_04085 [Lachnospiraceae bacterium]